jgi:hypothetical protein
MSENEKGYKDLRLMLTDLKVNQDKIKGSSIRSIIDLDKLINEHMNFFNVSFTQVFSNYLTLKTKKIKFYQRINFDPARAYG